MCGTAATTLRQARLTPKVTKKTQMTLELCESIHGDLGSACHKLKKSCLQLAVKGLHRLPEPYDDIVLRLVTSCVDGVLTPVLHVDLPYATDKVLWRGREGEGRGRKIRMGQGAEMKHERTEWLMFGADQRRLLTSISCASNGPNSFVLMTSLNPYGRESILYLDKT